jgi:putative sigma-54 modulation protein
MDVTPALREFVARKLGKLDKFFGPDVPAQVTLSVERDRHICEVTVPVDGRLLRGEESSADMYASVDLVVDKVERQVHKYKTLVNRKLRRDGTQEPGTAAADARGLRGAAALPHRTEEPAGAAAAGAPDPDGWPPAVVRTKRFPLKPMAVEEAILEMNLLGHDFFVFANAETEQVNVVYRRRAGDYGLIEPER